MIQNNPANLVAAFEMLLEEIEEESRSTGRTPQSQCLLRKT